MQNGEELGNMIKSMVNNAHLFDSFDELDEKERVEYV